MLKQFDFGSFNVIPLTLKDALSLNRLMLRNAKHFSLYFPQTLAANLTVEESKKFITAISEDIKNKKQYLFAIKSEENVVGLVYIKELDWDKKEGELAICIGKQYSGKGWMAQSIASISTYAFETMGIELLHFIVHESNKKSISVATRCGFVFVKELKQEFTPLVGPPMDMQLYQLEKQDI